MEAETESDSESSSDDEDAASVSVSARPGPEPEPRPEPEPEPEPKAGKGKESPAMKRRGPPPVKKKKKKKNGGSAKKGVGTAGRRSRRDAEREDAPPQSSGRAVPSAPSEEVLASVFALMDTHKLRTVDLLHSLDRDGGGTTVDATELKAAFARHGVTLRETDLMSLMFALDQVRSVVDFRVIFE